MKKHTTLKYIPLSADSINDLMLAKELVGCEFVYFAHELFYENDQLIKTNEVVCFRQGSVTISASLNPFTILKRVDKFK